MRINVGYTLIIILYLAVTLGIAVVASKKELKSISDFQVGGRRVKSVVLFLTLYATLVGAASVVGYTGWYWIRGLSQLWLMTGIIGVYMIYIFYLAPRIHKFGVEKEGVTPANWMTYRYNSLVGYISSAFLIVAYLAVTAFQYMAMGTIFSAVSGISYNVCLIVAALVVITYTSFGGFWSVVWTDIIQGSITMIGLLVLVPILIVRAGGINHIFASVPPAHLQLFGHITPMTALTWSLVFLLAVVSWPDIWQRCYAAKDIKNLRKSLWYFTIAFLVFNGVIMLLIGFSSKVLYPDFADPEKILPFMVMDQLPGYLGAVIMAALLAVVMGTADSTLLITSVMVVKDFYQGLINPKASDKKMLNVSRIVTVVSGFVVLIIALIAPSMFDVWIMSADITGATLAIPILLGFVWKKPSDVAALSSIIMGFIGWLLGYLGWQPLDMGPVLIGGIFSLIAYVIVAYIKPVKA